MPPTSSSRDDLTEQEVLERLTAKPSPKEARRLVSRLREVGTDASVEMLRKRALSTPDPLDRTNAIKALQRRGTPAAADALIAILDSRDSNVAPACESDTLPSALEFRRQCLNPCRLLAIAANPSDRRILESPDVSGRLGSPQSSAVLLCQAGGRRFEAGWLHGGAAARRSVPAARRATQ